MFDFTGGPKIKAKAPKTAGFSFEKAPDPLADVQYTGNVETDTAAEIAAIDTAYRDRAKQERERFKNATDSEYWFAVCFKTRDDKEKFLTELGAIMLGDKYIDGHQLAKQLGIEL